MFMLIVILTVASILQQVIQAQKCQTFVDSFYSSCNSQVYSTDYRFHNEQSLSSCCWNTDCCTKLRAIYDNNCIDDCYSQLTYNTSLMAVIGVHTIACIPLYEIPLCLIDTTSFQSTCDVYAEDLKSSCGNNSHLVRRNQVDGEYSVCCWEESCCQKSRIFLESGCACENQLNEFKWPYYHFGVGIARLWQQVCGFEFSQQQICFEEGEIKRGGDQEFTPRIYASTTSDELLELHSTIINQDVDCQDQFLMYLVREFETCLVQEIASIQKMASSQVKQCCDVFSQVVDATCEACSVRSQYPDNLRIAQSLSIWSSSCPQSHSIELPSTCTTEEAISFFKANPLGFIYNLGINPSFDVFEAIKSIPMISVFSALVQIMDLSQETKGKIQTIIAPTNTAFASSSLTIHGSVLKLVEEYTINKHLEITRTIENHYVYQKMNFQQGGTYKEFSASGNELEFVIDSFGETAWVAFSRGNKSSNGKSNLQNNTQIIAGAALDNALLLVIDQVLHVGKNDP